MNPADELIAHVYQAFNERRVDDVLVRMTDTVSWPKASEGGRAVGKQEIRDYWSRQWREFDPRVDPVEIAVCPDGRIRVRVLQVVRSLSGELLFEGEVMHLYTLTGGLIERMDLGDNVEQTPSSAFARP